MRGNHIIVSVLLLVEERAAREIGEGRREKLGGSREQQRAAEGSGRGSAGGCRSPSSQHRPRDRHYPLRLSSYLISLLLPLLLLPTQLLSSPDSYRPSLLLEERNGVRKTNISQLRTTLCTHRTQDPGPKTQEPREI